MFKLTSRKIFIIFSVLVLFILSGLFFINSNHINFNYIKTKEAVVQVNSPILIKKTPTTVKNIPILVYHSVALPPVGHNESLIQKKYRIDPENFKAQMQYLIDNKYTPITFLHLVEYLLYDKEIPEKPVVITFDDGLLNQYENAFPILKEFGFSATFFVYPGVTTHRGFMDWNQLKEIVDAGNEIGSHTIIHYNLTTVDNETLNHELTGSKKMLEDKLGITVSTLAYPNYAENETVRNAVQNAGYVGARAGWRSVKNSADEILHLKAQEVGNTKNPFVMPK